MAKKEGLYSTEKDGSYSQNMANYSRCLYKYGYDKKDIAKLVGYKSTGAVEASIAGCEKERELTSPVYFDKKEKELISKIKNKVLAYYKETANVYKTATAVTEKVKKEVTPKKVQSLTKRKEALAKVEQAIKTKKAKDKATELVEDMLTLSTANETNVEVVNSDESVVTGLGNGSSVNETVETVAEVINPEYKKQEVISPKDARIQELEAELKKLQSTEESVYTETVNKTVNLEGSINKSQELSVDVKNLGDKFELSKAYMKQLEEWVKEPDGENCSVCGGQGWLLAPTSKGLKRLTCIKCLGHKIQKAEASVVEEELKKWIPNKVFREGHFDFDTFEKTVLLPVNERRYSFAKYVDFMDKTLRGLQSNIIPKKSYYIVAPDNYGKKWFAYECMKVLVENSHEIGGLVDIADIKQALEVSDYNKAKELLTGDIIFVTLSNMGAGYFSASVKYVLDYASKYGKPVFLFTRVQAHTWVGSDKNAMGLTYSNTRDYDYDKLEQVGLTGSEFSLAYRWGVSESNNSIKYREQGNRKG